MRLLRAALLIAGLIATDVLHSSLALAVDGPELTKVFPAGGQRGTVVEIVASGKFPVWPPSVWCDTVGIEWKPLETSGKFSVSFAADVPLGVHWVRLYEANGATSIKPIVVGAISESVETEPNDQIAEGPMLEVLPTVYNGTLEKSGDVDSVRLKLKAGETLIASIDAARFLNSPVDVCLQLVDSKGFVVEQNLDYHNLDPQLVYTAAADGEFAVRVFGFPSTPNGTIGYGGDAGFVYRLSLTTGPWVEYSDPLAVSAAEPTRLTLRGFNIDAVAPVDVPVQSIALGNESDLFAMPQDLTRGLLFLPIKPYAVVQNNGLNGEQPQMITLPTCVTGCLGSPSAKHAYAFEAKKESAWRFNLEARKLGSSLDAVLQLVDATDKVLATADDSGDSPDPILDWKCSADGVYRILIRDLYGSSSDQHFYRLTMEPQTPSATVLLAVDLVAGKVAQEIEIVANIERTFGFAEELKVQCEGIPAEVTCEPVVSKGEGESAKQVKLKLLANQPFQGSIRIYTEISPSAGQPPMRRFAKIASGQTNIWLSVVQP